MSSPVGETLEARLARGDVSLYLDMFEALAEAVTVRDLSGELVYANRAALETLGFDSLAELRRRQTTSIMEDYVVEDERGLPFPHSAVPSVRLLRGERVKPQLLRSIHKTTGLERWQLLKTTPLHDERGGLLGAMTVIEDVTATKTAEIHTRILAESGRILAASLDYERTLRNVVEIAVPALADYCAVDLIDDQGLLRRVGVQHRDPARQPTVAELRALEPTLLAPDHPVSRVLDTGTSELFSEFGTAAVEATARSERHRELIAALGLRSVVIVPMRIRGRTIGVMTLGTDRSRRTLRSDEVELAEQLGRRAAAAVENARLYTTLARVADTLQQALLPRPLPAIAGWELASLYEPSESELRIDIGGDFYELIESQDKWFAIVGDVAGKGVAAASVTALMRHGARMASRSEADPARILARLDEVLLQQPERAMATALCLRLRDGEVLGSSAGHPPAIVVSGEGELREAPRPDLMLGAFADGGVRHDEPIPVAPGELLIVYTDGVTDAPGPSDRFGSDRLRELLSAQSGAPPAAVLDRLRAELRRFSSGRSRDDIAALALRRAAG